MITIPMIGWVAKLGARREKLSSYSVAKYGPQQYTDPYMPDAGNGVKPDGAPVTNNDPHDANIEADALFQRAWVQHLVTIGAPAFYLLDNERSIWFATHRDVKPAGATMDEIRARIIDYAQRIREADPHAVIGGPEEWGWGGYIYSGYDQQWAPAHNWSSFPDRAAHGNADYVPWLLAQTRGAIDVLTLHVYPQGGEYSDDVSPSMQAQRNRSTRSLWDPNYVDEPWIDDRVRLIPRMREWSAPFAGMKTGITEYNWGAESHINGATTQADILGIFGRERLDIATRWTTPETNSPVYNAIKMYRDFGDVSVNATAPNPDSVPAFAATRTSDNALTIMLINKVTSDAPVTIDIANFNAA